MGNKKYPKYIAWIREQPCILCGGIAEAAHLCMSNAEYHKTNGRNDMWCIPLCPYHHRLGPDAQHNSGEQDWWDKQGIDPLPIAQKLWKQWSKD